LSEFSFETEKVDDFLEAANTIRWEQKKAVKRINHKARESHMIDGVELERVFIEKDAVMKKLYQFMEVRASFHSFPFVYSSLIRLKRPLLSKGEWFFDSFAIWNEKTKRLEEIKGLYSDVLLDEIKQLILKGIEDQK
jgi:hypothetical protein